MTDPKSLIDWRKEAKAKGVEDVNKLDKDGCKEAIAAINNPAEESGKSPEREGLEARAEKLELGDVSEMPDGELTTVVEELEKPELLKETPPVVPVKQELTKDVESQELQKELAYIEARKKEIHKRLSVISKELEDERVEIPYIEQLKKSRELDRKSNRTQTAFLLQELLKRSGVNSTG